MKRTSTSLSLGPVCSSKQATKKRKRLKQKSSKQVEAERPIKHRVPKGTAYGKAHATDEESETSEEESSYSEESD